MIRFERFTLEPLLKGGTGDDAYERLVLNPSVAPDDTRVLAFFRAATQTFANGGRHSIDLIWQNKAGFEPELENWTQAGEVWGGIGSDTTPTNWDASSGSYPSGAGKGQEYVATSAGTVGGASYLVGDTIRAIVDNASTSVTLGNWISGNIADPCAFRWTDGEVHVLCALFNNRTGSRRVLHLKSFDGSGIGGLTVVDELTFNSTYFGADGPGVIVKDGTAYGLFTVDDTDGEGYSLKLRSSTDLVTWTELDLTIEDSPTNGAFDDESLLAARMEDEGDYLKIYVPGGGTFGDYPEGCGLYRVAWDDIDTATETDEYPFSPVLLRGPAGGFDEAGIWSFSPFDVNGSKWALYEGVGTGAGANTAASNSARDTFYGGYNSASFSHIFIARDFYPEDEDLWDTDPALPDGRYYIRHSSGGYLCTEDDATADLTHASITHDRTQPSTVWRVDRQGDFYRISLASAGDAGVQSLELDGSTTANRVNNNRASIYPWGSFTDQQWHLVNVGPHKAARMWAQIMNRESGQVLETRLGAPGGGAEVVQNPANGFTRQHWEFIHVYDGTEAIVEESGDGSITYPPTYPDASEVVTLDGTQTLTSKTLVSPQLTGTPNFGGLTEAAKDQVTDDLQAAVQVTTRAEVAARAAVAADGTVIWWKGIAFEVSSGATAISDIANAIPSGNVIHPEHFGEVSGSADAYAILAAALDYMEGVDGSVLDGRGRTYYFSQTYTFDGYTKRRITNCSFKPHSTWTSRWPGVGNSIWSSSTPPTASTYAAYALFYIPSGSSGNITIDHNEFDGRDASDVPAADFWLSLGGGNYIHHNKVRGVPNFGIWVNGGTDGQVYGNEIGQWVFTDTENGDLTYRTAAAIAIGTGDYEVHDNVGRYCLFPLTVFGSGACTFRFNHWYNGAGSGTVVSSGKTYNAKVYEGARPVFQGDYFDKGIIRLEAMQVQFQSCRFLTSQANINDPHFFEFAPQNAGELLNGLMITDSDFQGTRNAGADPLNVTDFFRVDTTDGTFASGQEANVVVADNTYHKGTAAGVKVPSTRGTARKTLASGAWTLDTGAYKSGAVDLTNYLFLPSNLAYNFLHSVQDDDGASPYVADPISLQKLSAGSLQFWSATAHDVKIHIGWDGQANTLL